MDQYEKDLNKRLKSHGHGRLAEVKINVLENPKNKKLSITLKLEGNKYFVERDYRMALVYYNKALCCAVKGSEDVGVMYANRSAVALEMKSYDECLKNIELAREHNYPKQSLLKLKEREERCKKIISSKKTLEKGNEKLIDMLYGLFTEPYLIDCLEIVNNKNEKPYSITSKDLKVGDLIAIQKPFVGILTEDNFYINCSSCMKDCVFDLIPCDECASVMFCSENCKNSAFEIHQYECGIIDSFNSKIGFQGIFYQSRALFKALSLFNGSVKEMKQFLEEPNESSREIFTLDICNNEKQYLKAVYSLKYHSDVDEDLILEKLLSFYPKMKGLMIDRKLRIFVIRFIRRMSVTAAFRKLHKKEKIGGFYPLSTVTSLSCAPNVCCNILNDCKVVYTVQHPIKSGEKITITNGSNFSTVTKMERQEKILQIYNIKCECVACVDNYPMIRQQKIISECSVIDANYALQLADNETDPIKAYHGNCQYIQNNFDKFPCQEISMKILTNGILLLGNQNAN